MEASANNVRQVKGEGFEETIENIETVAQVE